MKNKIQNEKAITLITLVVAVSIMIIIASMLIYNAKTEIKMRNLKMMQNDIDLLDNKVDAYYIKYGALPAEIEYNVTPLPFESYKSPNDNDKYYVLDLKAFEGLTLNYGADFSNVTAENVADYTDLYVINEQSHHIYYVRGIEMDGVWYYTNNEEIEVTLKQRRWAQVVEYEIIEYYDGKMYGIDTWGNLFLFNSYYYGTITQNTTYINANDYFNRISLFPTKKIVQISAGDDHTTAIDEEGNVYTWGENVYKQLGDGTGISSSAPICISDILGNILNGKKIVQIAAGKYHTTAIDEEGKVYTWGYNYYGQLGNGTKGYSSEPICISDISENALNGKKIVQISAGGNNTIAIDEEGKVYIWGWNGWGQLGDGTGNNSSVPICISDISENALNGKKIVQISAEYDHTVAIDEEGKVYAWGYNKHGELGDGTTTNGIVPICISDISENALNGKKIVQISAGENNTIAIDEEGKVYEWGGLLGDGTYNSSNVPICISDISGNILNGKKIVQISAGIFHAIAIDEEGKVYTWGNNRYGQLGDGTTTNSSVPICISDIPKNALNGKKMVQISAGYDHTVAIDEEGKVYTWGWNGCGQLGNGTDNNSSVPICISDIPENALNGKKIVQISAGGGHTIAIDEEGKVYIWGYNEDGELGDGTITNSSVPICISDIPENALNGKKIVQISAGKRHIIAIDEEGKIYTWGYNEYGELGDGTTTNSIVPICISDISENALNGKKIVQISAGEGHTIAIDEEGKIYTWGYNEYGELGDGTTTNSIVPICINDISENALNGKKIVQISAGGNNTIAIDEEGKVYTWGNNYYKQLGCEIREYSSVPICISDISEHVLNGEKIVQISAGTRYTITISENGEIKIFGEQQLPH